MKTIKKDDKIKRVKDEMADKLVSQNGWQFCPKSEFKALNKDKDVNSSKSKPTNKNTKKKPKKQVSKV